MKIALATVILAIVASGCRGHLDPSSVEAVSRGFCDSGVVYLPDGSYASLLRDEAGRFLFLPTPAVTTFRVDFSQTVDGLQAPTLDGTVAFKITQSPEALANLEKLRREGTITILDISTGLENRQPVGEIINLWDGRIAAEFSRLGDNDEQVLGPRMGADGVPEVGPPTNRLVSNGLSHRFEPLLENNTAAFDFGLANAFLSYLLDRKANGRVEQDLLQIVVEFETGCSNQAREKIKARMPAVEATDVYKNSYVVHRFPYTRPTIETLIALETSLRENRIAYPSYVRAVVDAVDNDSNPADRKVIEELKVHGIEARSWLLDFLGKNQDNQAFYVFHSDSFMGSFYQRYLTSAIWEGQIPGLSAPNLDGIDIIEAGRIQGRYVEKVESIGDAIETALALVEERSVFKERYEDQEFPQVRTRVSYTVEYLGPN